MEALERDAGEFFEEIDPYVTLRLLAENARNVNEVVVWRFADILDEGWSGSDKIYEGLQDSDVCLVVTEGSSDVDILRASLPLVMPDLEDFFRFVDMSENYPFTGTGNLVNFAKGLARIRIQNRILVVVDNDTAGRAALARIRALDLPDRMRVTVLPDLPEYRQFPTEGPSGESCEDINGRAVSIELFLDLSAERADPVKVRWTGYNKELDAYQGELVRKEDHVRRFHEAVRRNEAYDVSKLKRLWAHLVETCASSSTSVIRGREA